MITEDERWDIARLVVESLLIDDQRYTDYQEYADSLGVDLTYEDTEDVNRIVGATLKELRGYL